MDKHQFWIISLLTFMHAFIAIGKCDSEGVLGFGDAPSAKNPKAIPPVSYKPPKVEKVTIVPSVVPIGALNPVPLDSVPLDSAPLDPANPKEKSQLELATGDILSSNKIYRVNTNNYNIFYIPVKSKGTKPPATEPPKIIRQTTPKRRQIVHVWDRLPNYY